VRQGLVAVVSAGAKTVDLAPARPSHGAATRGTAAQPGQLAVWACLGVKQQRRVRLEGSLWGGATACTPGPLHRRPAQGDGCQDVGYGVTLAHGWA
jgi:hypothetical protein